MIVFTVKEFLEGPVRLEELLRKLAGKLNSNQTFHPDQGFQRDLTQREEPQCRPNGRYHVKKVKTVHHPHPK